MKNIIVTGIGGSPSWNFVKSIMKDEQVRVVGTDASKYHVNLSIAETAYMLPRYDAPDYTEKLNELINKEGIEFVHTQPDVEVGRVSKDRDKINAKTFLPTKQVVEDCHNKYTLQKIMEKHDVAVPKTIRINKDTILNAFEELGETIWVRASSGAGGRGSLPCTRPLQVEGWLDFHGESDMIASEFLPGKNLAWESVWNNGELVSSLTWERLKYIIAHVSPSGITGTPDVASIVQRDDVNEIGENAVRAVSDKPNGIFSVDLRENKNGVPSITEINPGRFFTPSYFFTSAGANLPYAYLKIAYDEEPPKLPKYDAARIGCHWVRGIDMKPVLVEPGKL